MLGTGVYYVRGIMSEYGAWRCTAASQKQQPQQQHVVWGRKPLGGCRNRLEAGRDVYSGCPRGWCR